MGGAGSQSGRPRAPRGGGAGGGMAAAMASAAERAVLVSRAEGSPWPWPAAAAWSRAVAAPPGPPQARSGWASPPSPARPRAEALGEGRLLPAAALR